MDENDAEIVGSFLLLDGGKNERGILTEPRAKTKSCGQRRPEILGLSRYFRDYPSSNFVKTRKKTRGRLTSIGKLNGVSTALLISLTARSKM